MTTASKKSKAKPTTSATTSAVTSSAAKTIRARSIALPAEPAQERIAREAFLIWERQGRPHGLELEHWLQAEQLVRDVASV
jgi:hypothetical protein